jgi:hypothetical protein
VLAAIREDDDDAFQRVIAAGDVRRKIEWSIYEQTFPWIWTFTRDSKQVIVNSPECLHAIGIYGAERCFQSFRQQTEAAVNEALTVCAGSIIAGGNVDMIQEIADLDVSFLGTVKDAIRFHNNPVMQFLLEKTVQPDQDARAACLIDGNFNALLKLIDPPNGSKWNQFTFAQNQSVVGQTINQTIRCIICVQSVMQLKRSNTYCHNGNHESNKLDLMHIK